MCFACEPCTCASCDSASPTSNLPSRYKWSKITCKGLAASQACALGVVITVCAKLPHDLHDAVHVGQAALVALRGTMLFCRMEQLLL